MTFLRFDPEPRPELPPGFGSHDLRYHPGLVRYFLEQFTEEGDVVIDPFAGFGTTLIVGEAMGREAWGVERDERRATCARSRLAHPERLLTGDALRLPDLPLPRFDFAMSAPPFMARSDPDDPLTGRPGTYGSYLAKLRLIYDRARDLMNPGAHVVIEVANLREHGEVTTLAWDVARTVGEVLRFEGEVVASWPGCGYGFDHTYGLVFSAADRRPPRSR